MCKWFKWRTIQCISFFLKKMTFPLSVPFLGDVHCAVELYFFTWLIAGSRGQGRHDSCQPCPGVPQAVENGKRESELYWRTSSIYGQALCHWTLQENQVLALINTRFHTVRLGLNHGIILCLMLLMGKHTDLWCFLLQWIYLQWAAQLVISTSDTSL